MPAVKKAKKNAAAPKKKAAPAPKKIAKLAKPLKAPKAEKPVKAVKPAIAAKPAKPAKPAKLAKPLKAPKAEKPVKVEKISKTVTVIQIKGSVTQEVITKKTKASLKASILDTGKKAAETLSRLKGGGAASSMSMASASEVVCREVACEGLGITSGYCRLHYIKNWKRIKRKDLILKEKKLNRFIEELVAKYPDKYIEVIRQDLTSDKDFSKVVSDLDIDESSDDSEGDTENVEQVIESIKRDFDDDDGGF